MEGAVLKNAKLSAQSVLASLQDNDMFGLVTFSTHVRVAFPLQRLNSGTKRAASGAIQRLGSENDRDIEQGLRGGAKQFGRFSGSQTAGRYLFLLTSGMPNKGMTGTEELLELALSLAVKFGYSMSTFAYDKYFDEEFMIACARATNGRACFVQEEDVNRLPSCLDTEARRVSQATLREAVINIELPGGSNLANVAGGIPEGNASIKVGDIGPGDSLMVVFDLKGRPARRTDFMVNLEYTEPAGLSVRKERTYLNIPLASGTGITYDEQYGPALIEFGIQSQLAASVEQILSDRIRYADSFKEQVEDTERENVELGSEYLSDAVARFKQMEHQIRNKAIEDELLAKRIKYREFQLLYGR